MQNAHSVIYNHRCDGAWCSGSTWASDSHCVGSIPIAPANANTLLSERVFSYIRHSACLHEKSGGYKKKVTRRRVCVGHKRSATEARRKTCITIPHTHSACLHEKSGGYKKKVTRQRVCVGRKRSAMEARRKTCITLICSQFIYSFANIASRIYNNINDINGGKYGY